LPNATPALTLTAQKLTRSFGNQTVIHDVSLQLKRGEVLGLLGHNGAGKSTTMQMLTGCLLPDSGTIEICGIDLLRHPTLAKAHIGYLPETPPLYRELSEIARHETCLCPGGTGYRTATLRLDGQEP
jgi:ABC-2 type transport system ATP-binding protein